MTQKNIQEEIKKEIQDDIQELIQELIQEEIQEEIREQGISIFAVTSGPKLEKEPAEGVYIWTQPWCSNIILFQFSSRVSTSGPSPAAKKARVLKGKV